jgi:hypothetical protein
MPRLMLQYLVAVSATLVAVGVLRGLRGFYWPHALLVGLAIGGLVFTTWRTIDRMRSP